MELYKNSNIPIDTVVLLSDEEKPSKNNIHKKYKRRHNNEPKINIKMSEEKNTLHQNNINISQQIDIENQEIQCFINLNTSVYEHRSRCRKRCERRHRSRYSEERKRGHKHTSSGRNKDKQYDQRLRVSGLNHSVVDRTIPKCFRKVCWKYQECKKEQFRRDQVHDHIRNARKNRSPSTSKGHHKKKICKDHHKNRYSSLNIKQTDSTILLSPISSTPLEEDRDNLTYEDLGSVSIESDEVKDKPTPHIRHRRHMKHCNHKQPTHSREGQESKLDTLIKRTKERERNLVAQSRFWFSSTPIRNDCSSIDFPMTCSDMDISITSLPTLVLGTHPAYSPSCPVDNVQLSWVTDELSHFEPYTPSSPTSTEH